MSKNVSDNGKGARQLLWPSPETTNGLAREGSYPTPETVARLQTGLTKSQVMKLIGPQHFNEGIATREWNYLFHLRQNGTGEYILCQYKVLFDLQGHSGSQYWLPASCGVSLPETPAHTVLQTDGLFGFNGDTLNDMTPESRKRLDQFVTAMSGRLRTGERITVTAYTDRLGSPQYNQELSARRASAVAVFLNNGGIPADRITTRGKGESDPVSANCGDNLSRSALIACLYPDRRVEIERISGTDNP